MAYRIKRDKDGKKVLQTILKGKALMFHPLLNKSNAFSDRERLVFNLIGKLPPAKESLAMQTKRAYKQYEGFKNDEAKSIFLHVLYNTNEILFYKLITEYINEITAKLYTPTVSMTVKHYSMQYRQPRGMFISLDDSDKLDNVLKNRTNKELDLLVISDGEAILGIGDQGIGGMGIPVAKAAMHVAAGGISPYKIAPLFIDVGTDNSDLKSDSMYLGLRRNRLRGQEYKTFIQKVIDKIYKEFPDIVIHFEDFSKDNARMLMKHYGEKRPCFNDDIQGTAVIVLAAIMTALKYKKEKISEQRIVLVGPGAAGLGVINAIRHHMEIEIGNKKEALDRIWLVGRNGLLIDHEGMNVDLKAYAHDESVVASWTENNLKAVISEVKPTIIIGMTGQAKLFDKEVIKMMVDQAEEPIILPLSNPSAQSECVPQDIVDITDEKVHVATGSPFTVMKKGVIKEVSQCNNIYAFPAIGAAMVAGKAIALTVEMMQAAAVAISEYTYTKYSEKEMITPMLDDLQDVTTAVAKAIIKRGASQNMIKVTEEEAIKRLNELQWQPEYLDYEHIEKLT